MASYNRVTLIGNLTRDPVLKYLPSQTAIAEFGLAMNRKFRTAQGEDRDEVCFVDCTVFGKQAEVINQYCQKGKLLFIEGRLKYDSWEDKQGGGKRSRLIVVVENFQFLGSRDGGGGTAGGGGNRSSDESSQDDSRPQRPQARPAGGPPQQRQAPQQEPPFPEEQQFQEDDIPF